MKVLITGAAGLIGSRLIKYLRAQYPHYTLVGIDDMSGGLSENLDPNVEFHKLDVNDVVGMTELFKQHDSFDVVFHAAAYAAECLSPFIRQFNYKNNLIATAGIVNLCIKYNVGRLVFCSSNSVYGSGTPPFSEETLPVPMDPYAVAKLASEMDIRIASEQHGLEYCILRLHNVIGVGQNLFDSYRNVAAIFLYKSLVGDPITIFGDGLQLRAFSEVHDILEPLHRACVDTTARNQTINLGGIEHSTVLELAHIVTELTGAKIIHLPERHEAKYAFPTWQKSMDLLGFQHQMNLYDAVKSMWAWAQTLELRPRLIWPEYELDKGIYPQWTQEALKDGYWKSTI